MKVVLINDENYNIVDRWQKDDITYVWYAGSNPISQEAYEKDINCERIPMYAKVKNGEMSDCFPAKNDEDAINKCKSGYADDYTYSQRKADFERWKNIWK